MMDVNTVEQWLGSDNKLGIDIWNKKYKFENETFNDWLDRVSGGNKELRQLILEKKFLFGGRALTNRNTTEAGSYFNCYSSGYCPDDMNGIMQLNTNLALTYKAQGGQGVSLSKLRPKGSPVGTRYKSDGIIPFLEMFNQTTASISQGGSRKGALMVSLDIKHKEAEDFIKIKAKDSKIEKANLSLEIDNEFMQAVEKYYDTGETIKLHQIQNYNGHIVEYDIIPIELYKLLVQNCYDWADPACLFTDRFRNFNLMECDDNYQVETSNPCGEQPLPKNFCCNLGSLNLSEFVIDPYTDYATFDFSLFDSAVKIAIEALDTIIDENADNHPLKEQRDNSLNYRNIGLGVMGYANLLMKLGLTYGSDSAREFTDSLFNNLFIVAVIKSNELAGSKGSFPKYNKCLFDSQIIKNHFSQQEICQLRKYGLRNCSLISIAPTGSIGTMLGVSGGCEPEFAIKYQRKTESLNNGKTGYYDVYCNSVIEYQSVTGNKEFPDYFISASEIYWKDRVETQAIMQNHVDTAISSTVNLPKNTTIEDVEKLYLYAWKQGLKGITIFRSGCNREGILTTETKTETIDPKYNILTSDDLPRGFIESVPEGLQYRKYKLKNGCGNLYFFVGVDEDEGRIYDCFTNTDGLGGCTINTQANSRLLSAALRGGVPVEYLIQQLDKAGVCPSFMYKRGKGEALCNGKSCASAIGNVLKDILKEFGSQDEEIEEVIEDKQESNKPKCPECNMPLRFEGGCQSCINCGYSKCN